MNLPNGHKYSVFTSSAATSGKVVVVLDRKKKMVGEADPYPEGIPIQPFRRKQLEKEAALRLIAALDQNGGK